MPIIQVSFPNDLYELILATARHQGWSVSRTVRHMTAYSLGDYIPRHDAYETLLGKAIKPAEEPNE